MNYCTVLGAVLRWFGMDEQENIPEPIPEEPKRFAIPGAVVVAGVIIAGAIIYTGGFGSAARGPAASPVAGDQTGNQANAAAAIDAAALPDDDPSLGNPNAPVTIVEFSDFQCPYCARFFANTLGALKDKYVKTGKVRFVYRDFPLSSIHSEATGAAEAAACANEQGKFWEYHDKIFQNQQALGAANYKQWAKDLGLNAAAFNQCVDARRYADEVQKDFNDGRKAGISGTPTFFINGKMVVGALPIEEFEIAIEEALAAK